ncbi:cell division protein ZapA [Novosphingobium sp. PhB55]|uniref:cell division protein ZapA n=1 Tax=Novosphingobium sp. PhB55 TaxID=2485106 RepID=UPI0010649AF0|nr:cell division protein ZapA [Novosphingobium sp. PhB55]TDW68135.1 cell division protein ZapA [Novosphingobium sp. PhB55]
MANISLMIGGREFMLACADGEEAHLTRLAEMIDEKLAQAGAVGQTEPRMLLFASLMLADELHELRQRAQQPAAAPVATPPPAPAPVPEIPEVLVEELARIADHVEKLADLLEQSASNA